MSQFDPKQSDQLLETLKNELHNCQSQCNQAHVFLTEIGNRLHSTQELIKHYQISAQTKDERIEQLEQELKLKSHELETVNFEHEELRRRIKSEKHNASQYKAALHRCLDTSHLSDQEAKQVHSQARTLTNTNPNSSPNFEEVLALSSTHKSHHSINLAPPQIDSPQFIQGLSGQDSQNISHQTPIAKSHLKSLNSEMISSQVVRDIPEEKRKSFSGIKLPQFAPLKPR